MPEPLSMTAATIATTVAPAKLNLFLETPQLRGDGFHEIDTVMVQIDCVDEVTVRQTDVPGIAIQCRWAGREQTPALATPPPQTQLPMDDRNLAFAAAVKFYQYFGLPPSSTIQIVKRTPAGAGMGGASSDAAAVLRCLAALHAIDDIKILHRIAGQLGSDVPFFLPSIHGDCVDGNPIGTPGDPPGGTSTTYARAKGRGEILEPLGFDRSLHGVVVHPRTELSTARVYQANRIDPPIHQPDTLLDYLRGTNSSSRRPGLYNRLTAPAVSLCPAIGDLLRTLSDRLGSTNVSMTGSGSAVFGICRDRDHAAKVARELAGRERSPDWIIQFSSIADPAAVTIR